MERVGGNDVTGELDLPEAVVVRRPRRWPEPIWTVPIVALLIGAWMAFQAIRSHGPTITISFRDARSLAAGKTRLKYRDVEIGTVRAIGFSSDRERVIVTADLRREAEPWLVQDTHFWIVEPRVTLGEVSGLQTLISGAYISLDIGSSSTPKRDFEGLDKVPVVIRETRGRAFIARAARAVAVGSPIFFHRLQVGQVTKSELEANGTDVEVDIWVNAPYDHYITTGTRFWDAGGIRGTVDASGVRVEAESLVTLLLGGISFETPPYAASAPPAATDHVFALFPSRDEAMMDPDGDAEDYRFVFHQSVRGLSVGAPVEFRGIPMGEITRIGIDYDAQRAELSTVVEARLFPSRLQARMRQVLPDEVSIPLQTLFKQLVDHGLRAQLAPANLLTGQLFVSLDFFPRAQRAALNLSRSRPDIPTVPSDIEDLRTSVTRIVHKLDRLPFDDIGEMVQGARQVLGKAGTTLDHADTVVAQFRPGAPRGADLDEALQQVARAARSVQGLADSVERHPESLIRGRK
jgi:paraquat-inducible protein B